MFNGWHIGIASLVFFAAMTPATRAQASTSPLAALPSTMSANVSGFMEMKPSATATRSVSAFCDTSTIRTSPFSSIWVSCSVIDRCSLLFLRLGGQTKVCPYGFNAAPLGLRSL